MAPTPTPHHHPADVADEAMADLLDLDADVLRSVLGAATGWVRRLAGGLPTRRILDVGSGTGTASIALAHRFPHAQVVAIDRSPALLGRLRAKALDLGLAGRIRTVEADLDGRWPALDPVDVAWASMSLHHLADPDRALRQLRAAVRPGGLIAVAEMGTPLRFLPDDLALGEPGLEERCLEAMTKLHAELVPTLGSDWGPRLAGAGLDVTAERSFAVDRAGPDLAVSAGRYAQGWFRRMRQALDGVLAAEDAAVLDVLVDSDGPDSLRRRADLAITGSRTVWVARRP